MPGCPACRYAGHPGRTIAKRASRKTGLTVAVRLSGELLPEASGEFCAELGGGCGHGPELAECGFARQVLHAAVWREHELVGGHVRQGLTDPVGYLLGALDGVIAEVQPSTEQSRPDWAVSIEICLAVLAASSGRNE